MLGRKIAKTFGNYFKKPHLDLIKPIADEVAFRNLWTGNPEAKIPEDLPPVRDILFKDTYKKSMGISVFYEVKNDLEAVREMMTNSVFLMIFSFFLLILSIFFSFQAICKA